jgi:ABC-type proline/glycine betaine transport system permease subunit
VIELPIGAWVEAVVDFLRAHGGVVFDGLAELTLALVNAIYLALVLPHPLVVTAVLAGLAGLATGAGFRRPSRPSASCSSW